MKHRNRVLLPAAATVVAGVLVGSVVADHAASAQPRAGFPSKFTNPQPNAYFPLTPGLVLHYRGTDDGAHLRETVTVTHRTKQVNGVAANVLVDVLRRSDGSVAEKTHDWYADDNKGNVWYLGERTATYDPQGHVKSRGGSWEAGVKGAVAGVIMPASPRPTDAYRQEFWKGHAEDQAWIVSRHGTIRTPLRKYHHVVRSYEWSRLEKHNVSLKLYVRGIGIASEQDVAGGTETFTIVKVSRP